MRTALCRTALFAALTLTTCVQAASQIALFTDDNCQDSYKGLEGPNGYPNGTCTDFRRSGEYGSLQVVGLDPGCAGILTFPCLLVDHIFSAGSA